MNPEAQQIQAQIAQLQQRLQQIQASGNAAQPAQQQAMGAQQVGGYNAGAQPAQPQAMGGQPQQFGNYAQALRHRGGMNYQQPQQQGMFNAGAQIGGAPMQQNANANLLQAAQQNQFANRAQTAGQQWGQG